MQIGVDAESGAFEGWVCMQIDQSGQQQAIGEIQVTCRGGLETRSGFSGDHGHDSIAGDRYRAGLIRAVARRNHAPGPHDQIVRFRCHIPSPASLPVHVRAEGVGFEPT